MKVILLENIRKVGKKFETVEVADGYALNFLLPEGRAREYSPHVEAELTSKRDADAQAAQARQEKDYTVLEEQKELTLSIASKANEHGHLFAGIHGEDIAHEINTRYGTSLDAEQIELTQTIKEVGEYDVTVAFPEGKQVKIPLVVSAEN